MNASWTRPSRLALLVAAALCAPATAWPFTQISRFSGGANPVVYNHWDADQLPIRFLVDPGGSGIPGVDAVELVKRAFATWEQVGGSSIHFEYDGLIPDGNGDDNTTITDINSGDAFRDDGRVDVIFDDTGAYFDQFFGPGSGVLGLAFPTIDIDTGRMRDSDIVISVPNVRQFSNVDLEGVLVHEIGHLCGLGHSAVFADVAPSQVPTMFPYAGVYGGDPAEQRSLSEDDVAGVSYLYPNDSFRSDFGTIRGTITDAKGNPGFGTHVTALDIRTGHAVGAVAGYFSGNTHDGTYSIPGLPPGDYQVFIQALDGQKQIGFVSGFNISEILKQTYGLSFPKEYFNNTEDPAAGLPLGVEAASTTGGVDFVQQIENGGAPLASDVTIRPDRGPGSGGGSGHGGGGGCRIAAGADSSPGSWSRVFAAIAWIASQRRTRRPNASRDSRSRWSSRQLPHPRGAGGGARRRGQISTPC